MKLKVKDSKELKTNIAVSGLTITGLSKIVGVTNNYLGNVINGIKNPSPELARSIVLVLNSRLGSSYKISDIFFTVSVEKFPHYKERIS